MTAYGLGLFPQHAELLRASAITPEHARVRGYVSVDTKTRLEQLGVTRAARSVPGLLVPWRGVDGSVIGYQYRPDEPRINAKGQPIKYETPVRQPNRLDIPPGVGSKLADPSVPLWITEGSRKADSAACIGVACVSVAGVWGWLGTNNKTGKVAVADFRDIALNGRRVVVAYDSDVMTKPTVRKALDALADYLRSKGAAVAYCHLPDHDQSKTGLDDYIAAGHTGDDLCRLVRPDPPAVEAASTADTAPPDEPPAPPVEPVSLTQAVATFRRWLHLDDMAPVLVVAATIVANLGDGDSVWVLIVGPNLAGKPKCSCPAPACPTWFLRPPSARPHFYPAPHNETERKTPQAAYYAKSGTSASSSPKTSPQSSAKTKTPPSRR
jgi:hypothetical protein